MEQGFASQAGRFAPYGRLLGCGRRQMIDVIALSTRRDFIAPLVSARLLRGMGDRQLQHDDEWEVLLARANEGDGAAFGRFLYAVTPSLRRVIRNRGVALPPDQHEDILQDVLLAIHLKRQTWRKGEPVRPWLYAVARYKVVDAFRRRGAAINLPIDDFADILPDETVPEPLVSRDTDLMLAQIDSRSASLVRAVAIDGKTAEEAGKTLGLSAGAARVVLHRALRRLSEVAERMMK